MFPLIGLALQPIFAPLITPALYAGVLFLCVLPSTVQSSIAFTSIARGNVSAAVCSASASSLIGIFLTPLVASAVIQTQGSAHASALHSMGDIVMQLLVPFLAGHFARRWIGAWIERNKGVLKFVDQGSILLVVYTAFSEAVVEGLWRHISPLALVLLLVVCVVLLAIALIVTSIVAKQCGFDRADQITIIFCGSKKSLAAGIPMAKVIFAGSGGRRGRPAADAVPPDSVDDLRGARAALGCARRCRFAARRILIFILARLRPGTRSRDY